MKELVASLYNELDIAQAVVDIDFVKIKALMDEYKASIAVVAFYQAVLQSQRSWQLNDLMMRLALE